MKSSGNQSHGDQEQDKPAPSDDRHNEAGTLVTVTNAALIGVPASYAVSSSLPVTAIAAILAVVLVVGLWARRRS
jgi:uncharacterized membrane protein